MTSIYKISCHCDVLNRSECLDAINENAGVIDYWQCLDFYFDNGDYVEVCADIESAKQKFDKFRRPVVREHCEDNYPLIVKYWTLDEYDSKNEEIVGTVDASDGIIIRKSADGWHFEEVM